MRLDINMKGCELGCGIHDCELDIMHNFYHDDTIGNFSSSKTLRHCDDSARCLYNALNYIWI